MLPDQETRGRVRSHGEEHAKIKGTQRIKRGNPSDAGTTHPLASNATFRDMSLETSQSGRIGVITTRYVDSSNEEEETGINNIERVGEIVMSLERETVKSTVIEKEKDLPIEIYLLIIEIGAHPRPCMIENGQR